MIPASGDVLRGLVVFVVAIAVLKMLTVLIMGSHIPVRVVSAIFLLFMLWCMAMIFNEKL